MSVQINNASRSRPLIDSADSSSSPPRTESRPAEHHAATTITPRIRPVDQRRTPPDRGIIPLAAKDRIGPKIWALYGKVDNPVLLKDDRFVEPSLNDFYRDQNGWAFLLLPYAAEADPNRPTIADAAYRRSIALGITERPEVFLSCLYHYQLPEYRCIALHQDKPNDVVEVDRCLVMIEYEVARLAESLSQAAIQVDPRRKIKPVTLSNTSATSNNLLFALNTLYLHHHYSEGMLAALLHR